MQRAAVTRSAAIIIAASSRRDEDRVFQFVVRRPEETREFRDTPNAPSSLLLPSLLCPPVGRKQANRRLSFSLSLSLFLVPRHPRVSTPRHPHVHPRVHPLPAAFLLQGQKSRGEGRKTREQSEAALTQHWTESLPLSNHRTHKNAMATLRIRR